MNPEQTSVLASHLAAMADHILEFRNGQPGRINDILHSLELISSAAGDAGLTGLQDVCLLLQENLQDQLTDNIAVSVEQVHLLDHWSALAGIYLTNPSNPDTAEQLLQILQNNLWRNPLSPEDAGVLKDMLCPQAAVTEPVPATGSGPVQAPSANPVQTCLDNLNRFVADNLGSQPQHLSQLSSLIEELGNHAGDNGEFAIQDLCLFLNENIVELMLSNEALNDAQNTLMASWLNLAARAMQTPPDMEAARALIENLQNSLWVTPMPDNDAQVIAGMLGINFADHGNARPVTESETAVDDVLSSYIARLRETIMACLPEGEQNTGLIAEAVEQLGIYGGDANLLGFQDVCLLLQENLLDAVADQRQLKEEQINLLHTLPDLMLNYLQSPRNPDSGAALVAFLQNPGWINPITHADAEVLRDLICPAISKPEVPAEKKPDVSAQPCPISTELVEMLIEEIRQIGQNTTALDKAASASIEAALRGDALSQYAIRIERFGNACQAAELAGLYQACGIVQRNIRLMIEHDAHASETQLNILKEWPVIVQTYLELLGNKDSAERITSWLQSTELPDPLPADVAPALIDLLCAPYLIEAEAAREQRQTTATADDVSIRIPGDINQELLDGLLQELPLQTENFSAAIQAIIEGNGDIKDLEKAQRIAHTVKGAANTVGIRGIANLTHQVEDILIILNKNQKLPSRALASTLMNSADCLEEMSEALIEQGPAPANAQQVLQEVLDWINRLEKEGIGVLESDLQPVESEAAARDSSAEDDEEKATIPALRVPANLIDDMIRILGETIILTTQLQENVRRSTTESESLFKHNNLMQNLIGELEQQVELRGIAFSQQRAAVNQSEIFDPLELEQYNELHTVTNRLTETAVDSFELNRNVDHNLRELDDLLFEQSRLHHQVQELVMKTRMIPIKSITPRLQRAIRQTCRTTGKLANLHLKGSETLVDSDILTGLLDPLMHMLRNAIDHGIETRDERISKGKNPEGRIDLEFSREGTQIVVRCRDDGAGLNRDAIRITAIKRELIEPQDILSPHELDRLILLPGFSTKKETTQVSGRGIGMDVVYTQILAIKGSIHIESERDAGTLFELRLPVTLISSHSLLIRHRDQIIAISNRGVIQILHPSDSQIINDEGAMQCRVGESIYEAVNLEDLIDLPGDRRLRPRETRPALLVREEEINKIVFMQEIMDVRELVIKPMGTYMKGIKGVPGATILGDGSVVPVLDIPELLRNPHKIDPAKLGTISESYASKSLPMALVVDDSLSARRSLAQVIKDAGYDVRTAKDGLEAIDIIKKKKPDIMLVDFEMPRMNGMELSSHVRTTSDTADIPIIMVTSRSTDKHREQAKAAGVNIYLTKPFNDDELLDHVSNLLL